jgi:hypothetical protein
MNAPLRETRKPLEDAVDEMHTIVIVSILFPTVFCFRMLDVPPVSAVTVLVGEKL